MGSVRLLCYRAKVSKKLAELSFNSCEQHVGELFDHHRMMYLSLEFYCEHPSSPTCHSKALRRPNRTGKLLRHHQNAIKAGLVVHFSSPVYNWIKVTQRGRMVV